MTFPIRNHPRQIHRADVQLADDPRLQDGMQQAWTPDAVAEHVAAAVQRFSPCQVRMQRGCLLSAAAGPAACRRRRCQPPAVLARRAQVATFDAGGVSGHPNHLAVCAGVLRWWTDEPSSSGAPPPQLWQLQTVGLLRKYLGPMDAALAWLLGAAARRRCQAQLHVCWRPALAWNALLAHTSQMVW